MLSSSSDSFCGLLLILLNPLNCFWVRPFSLSHLLSRNTILSSPVKYLSLLSLTLLSCLLEAEMDAGGAYNPRTVEEVFRDFKGRRAGMIKALTTGKKNCFFLLLFPFSHRKTEFCDYPFVCRCSGVFPAL